MNPPQHAPAPTPLVTVDADHPWLGLASFTEETQRFFFGRDAEIAEIFVRVRDHTLTVLYGQSGLGKSSLLGAGLMPKLRVEDYRPVLIRLRYDETVPPLLDQVFAEIEKTGLIGAHRPATLWEWLHHRDTRPADFDTHPPVLVFDQFEEIFTLGQRAERLEETRALFTQLAELIENRSPAALRARFQEDRRLARDYDNAPTPARLVVTLREDFLSHLEQWKKVLPSLMKNRMALDLLDGPQALEAVVNPGRMEGRNLVDEEVGAAIVRFVAKKEAHVPLEEIGAVPPLLSLVCDELNRLRFAQNLPTITARLVESQSGEILVNFYHQSFANLPVAVRHFIEDRLITEGGHRNPVAREDALTAFRRAGVTDPTAALDQLVTRRLISPEERGGLVWIELTHDVLAPLVVRSRDERLERERAAEAERREMEARKARNKLRFLLSLFSVLTLLAVAGAIYGFLSSREARHQSAEATAQRDEARYNDGLGWMLRAQVAEERKDPYPDLLLYAARAIGAEGVGRPADAPEGLPRLIREDRNPEAYQAARKRIANYPAFLPVWSTAPYPAAATGLDVSADGRHLALATADGAVRLWDLREQTLREIQKPDQQAGSIAFFPTGKQLAVIGMKEVHLYGLGGGESSEIDEDTRVVAISPGGEMMATAGKDGSIRLRRDGKVESIATGMEEAASAITFSAENSRAAAVYPSGIRVFFPHYPALAYGWSDHQEKSSAAALSPDGSRLAAGTPEGEVLLYDVASAAVLGRCSGEQRHGGAVMDLAFRPDGRQLASASADGTVRLWEVTANIPTVTATLRGHAGGVTKLAWFPGGGLLATAGADGSGRIWDARGVPVPSPDIYHYLAAQWYQFDPATREATWSGGEGAVNVPADSLLGIHRAKAEVIPALLAAGSWNGLPPTTPVPPALVAAAEAAANAGRWCEVDLRLAQWQRLASSDDRRLAILARRTAAVATEGESFTNAGNTPMIWCPADTFTMGSPEDEDDRQPIGEVQHQVTLTRGFWIGKFEVTQEEWISIMGSNPAELKSEGPRHPVERIDWNQAMEFCRKLTDLERSRGALPAGWEYSLPTEAEWEYACRAGNPGAYCFGNDRSRLHLYGNSKDATYAKNYPRIPAAPADESQDDGRIATGTVGGYEPNSWGIHDMHGNVLEWCRDKIDARDQKHVEPGKVVQLTDPIGTQGSNRETRGGSYRDHPMNCRSARGFARSAASSAPYIGMRVALVAVPPGS